MNQKSDTHAFDKYLPYFFPPTSLTSYNAFTSSSTLSCFNAIFNVIELSLSPLRVITLDLRAAFPTSSSTHPRGISIQACFVTGFVKCGGIDRVYAVYGSVRNRNVSSRNGRIVQWRGARTIACRRDIPSREGGTERTRTRKLVSP